MKYDVNKIDDMILALLALTLHDESEYGARAWKGYDWDVLSRLHEKGYLGNPVGKAKSVVVTKEGVARSRALFIQYFGEA